MRYFYIGGSKLWKSLKKSKRIWKDKILIERSKTVVKLTEWDIREYYEQALKSEPQIIINFLIKEILLFDDKIEIHYNCPIKISPDDDNQDFSFYSKTVKLTATQNIIIIMQI